MRGQSEWEPDREDARVVVSVIVRYGDLKASAESHYQAAVKPEPREQESGR